MRNTTISIFFLILLSGLFLGSCSLIHSPVIRIEGSSTLYPLSLAVTEEYQRQRARARIALGFSGTGGGIRKLIDGEADITDASRPITPRERSLAEARGFEYVELPVAYDGIVVAVNRANTWCDSLTVKELRRIWHPDSQNRLILWSQIRPDWPEERIFLFGPGNNSGTVLYFSVSVLGDPMAIRGDFSSSEDDNLTVLALRNNPQGLGFFGYSYYEKNRDGLKLVAIDDENPDNGEGPVQPGIGTIMDGTYQPLSRPLFLYVRSGFGPNDELIDFLEFYLRNATRLAFEVGLVPLPDDLYELVIGRLKENRTGSMYEGLEFSYDHPVGELLRSGTRDGGGNLRK